jgi:hypothetical protein
MKKSSFPSEPTLLRCKEVHVFHNAHFLKFTD